MSQVVIQTTKYIRELAQNIMHDFTPEGKIYQGKVDVTQHYNFQEISDELLLNQKEYDDLIKVCQQIADIEVEKFFKLKQLEKQYE